MRLVRDIFRSYAVLDADGKHVNGSDKESNHHYGDAYELLFVGSELCDVKITETRSELMHQRCSTRDRVKLMMEIGVADGSSLLAWREVFPNATCVGLDIHDAAHLRGEDRVEFHIGDATWQHNCVAAANGREFDFICEDATHKLGDSLLMLLYLWPFVKPGGLYVIEEFANIGALRRNVTGLWPNAEVVDTIGPFGGVEPLVVFRKP